MMSGVPSLSPTPSVNLGKDNVSVASSVASYGKRDALENRALAMKKMKERALNKIKKSEGVKSQGVSVAGGEDSYPVKSEEGAEGQGSGVKVEEAKMERRR